MIINCSNHRSNFIAVPSWTVKRQTMAPNIFIVRYFTYSGKHTIHIQDKNKFYNI